MKIQQTQTLTEMTKIWHTIYHEIVDANGILIFSYAITNTDTRKITKS